jgi:hypothetical protein
MTAVSANGIAIECSEIGARAVEDAPADIPGARLRIVPGHGHFLPEALVPLLIDEIAGHCLDAEEAAKTGSSP